MGGTLLLADDSITIQKVVELTFAETDHTVVAVGSGRELLARVAEVRPDVVLCDVVMPDMSGYEVCQTLKSGSDTLRIPVILLTGTFEPFDRDRALAAGCDAIVTKPFEARELIGTVDDLLRRGPSSAVGTVTPLEEAAELPEVGIPEGVPSLDFTSSSLNRSGAPGADVLSAPPPDLPVVELTDTFITAPPVAPPELSQPLPPAPDVAAPPPTVLTAPPPSAEPLPDLDFRFDEQPAPPAAPTRQEPAPLAPPAAAESPFGGDVGKTQKLNIADLSDLFSPKTQPPPRPVDAATTQPLVSAPFGTIPSLPPVDTQPLPAPPEPPAIEPAAAAPPEPFFPAPPTVAAPEPSWGLTAAFNAITSGAGQAASAEPEPPPAVDLPPAEPEPEPEPARAPEPVAAAPAPVAEPAAVVPAGPLSDADVERIARRVLELATPLLEQIAWELLPDVAETLVRARIAELEAAAEAEN